ncbi:MAG: hypothetical protein KAS61_04590, partial [Spirochaetes bacterium]|nr:hypothetical protein [Spirochaetota bacterium]
MRTRDIQQEKKALNTFTQKKVVMVPELALLLQCSPTTVRRRLKGWNVYTSYNKNGQYYTLASIPQFSKKGLWQYRGIFFSKHGTLKNTIIHFVRISEKGLSNSELAEIIGVNPHSFMPQFKELAELRREKYGRQVVYYSSEPQVHQSQKEKRFPPEPPLGKLPPNAESIAILVERIRNPKSSIVELSRILSQKGYTIGEETIRGLFQYHGLLKKTLDTSP